MLNECPFSLLAMDTFSKSESSILWSFVLQRCSPQPCIRPHWAPQAQPFPVLAESLPGVGSTRWCALQNPVIPEPLVLITAKGLIVGVAWEVVALTTV